MKTKILTDFQICISVPLMSCLVLVMVKSLVERCILAVEFIFRKDKNKIIPNKSNI